MVLVNLLWAYCSSNSVKYMWDKQIYIPSHIHTRRSKDNMMFFRVDFISPHLLCLQSIILYTVLKPINHVQNISLFSISSSLHWSNVHNCAYSSITFSDLLKLIVSIFKRLLLVCRLGWSNFILKIPKIMEI